MPMNRGDLLVLREREWRGGTGSLLVTVIAVGDTRYVDGDWWTATKVEVVTWQARPEVLFIEVRAASVRLASSRGWGRSAVPP